MGSPTPSGKTYFFDPAHDLLVKTPLFPRSGTISTWTGIFWYKEFFSLPAGGERGLLRLHLGRRPLPSRSTP